MRVVIAVAAMSLAGCSHPGIVTADDAPFSLDGAKSVLWALNGSSTPRQGGALLIVSDGDVTCEDLDGRDLAVLTSDVLSSGSGLAFTLGYYVWGNQGAVVDDRLFMGVTSVSGSNSLAEPGLQRYLSFSAFSGGFGFAVSNGTSAWLRVDEVGDDIHGAFDTGYWSGGFKATNCGLWDSGDTGFRDTGLRDTGWYTE
jgi:hypothetical protein